MCSAPQRKLVHQNLVQKKWCSTPLGECDSIYHLCEGVTRPGGGRGNWEEEGGQTEELVEEGLLGLSVLASTRTLPQLLLLSLLQGEPDDQGEGSYCESNPGCSKPRERKVGDSIR